MNVYPAALPAPQQITSAPASRTLLGTDEYPRTARALQLDESATEQISWPPMTEGEYSAFRTWWETDLVYGGAWFAATWPSPRGQIQLARRFFAAPDWQFIAGPEGGYWAVSATCEVSGRNRTIV